MPIEEELQPPPNPFRRGAAHGDDHVRVALDLTGSFLAKLF